MSNFPITLTDNAKKRLAELTAGKEGALGVVLRIAKGKGCGGNEYRMEHMTPELKAKGGAYDSVEIGEAASLFIPVEDSFHMFGIQIDYVTDELSNSEFKFINPNEVGRCGCGLSFSLDRDVKEDINPEDVQCYREF